MSVSFLRALPLFLSSPPSLFAHYYSSPLTRLAGPVHPPFSLTTIICENRLHKQVNNCFLRLTLLVIAVNIKHNKPILSLSFFCIAAVNPLPLSPAHRPPTLNNGFIRPNHPNRFRPHPFW